MAISATGSATGSVAGCSKLMLAGTGVARPHILAGGNRVELSQENGLTTRRLSSVCPCCMSSE